MSSRGESGGPARRVCYSVLRVAGLCSGALFAVSTTQALDPAHQLTQYSHAVWSRDNGELAVSVSALTQTSDGTLWIGSDTGLSRFDGVRFQPWRPPHQPLPSESIGALAGGPDGSLWIGTREGLSHWKDGTLRSYQTSQGPTGPGVTEIRLDSAGIVWAATAGFHLGGVCRMQADRLACGSDALQPSGDAMYALFEDKQKMAWAGGLSLCHWNAEMPVACEVQGERDCVYSIAQDRQEMLWIGGNGLKQMVDGKLIPYPLPGKQPSIRALLTDRDGGLWIGTLGQGLMRLYQGRVDQYTHLDGLSSDTVRSLYEDREGNIWVGTDGGLDRFREFAVTTIGKREGLSNDMASAVYASSAGGVWVGTANGLDYADGNRIKVYDKRDGLPNSVIDGIFQEQAGRLWVHTTNGLAYSEQGRFHRRDMAFGRPIRLAAAAENRDHTVWMSDPENGLLHFKDAQITAVVPWSEFKNKYALALLADEQEDALWLGFQQGGVAWYKPGQPVRWYGLADTSERASVLDFLRTRDGSLWIATTEGLRLLRGERMTSLRATEGLPCERISAVLEDQQSGLWLKANCGVVQIPGDDLAAWAADRSNQVRARLFDTSDGMRGAPAASGYFRRGVKAKDGRFWFAAFNGVAVVDPNHLPENRLAPPIEIEGITASNARYAVGARLPPLTRELTIDYTGKSFVDPRKMRFRYRLEGYETEWHETAGRQAVYTNLPPGEFTFRVLASNNDGIWNQQGETFPFAIAPAYYQTNWFRGLCVAGLALALWSLHRLRLRQVGRQLNLRFQERLGERTRIAQEMHDTLLPNLCGLALQLDGLAKNRALSGSIRSQLVEIRRDTDGCMQQAREFVWDLRAPAVLETDLVQALTQAGEEILVGAPVEFRVTVNGNGRRVAPAFQQQIIRIIQEAARNSLRYSQAKEIEIVVSYIESGRLRVRLRDDGCGFDLEEASRKLGHWGLTTMRERARKIGAELTISSTPGQGTIIDILAPMEG